VQNSLVRFPTASGSFVGIEADTVIAANGAEMVTSSAGILTLEVINNYISANSNAAVAIFTDLNVATTITGNTIAGGTSTSGQTTSTGTFGSGIIVSTPAVPVKIMAIRS
jgi:hypothetical protein